jgi:hypothetical protein
MERFCVDLSKVSRVIQMAKSHLEKTGDLPELEFRLGLFRNRFIPGMSEELMTRLEERFDTFRDWNTVSDVWRLIHTYYHKSSIPHDTRQLRSDLVFQSDVVTHKTTMEKVCHTSATFITEGSTQDVPVDFRVAFSVEKTIPTRDIPDSVVPHRCVIKLRKEYTYSPADNPEPVIAFHFTKRWSGGAYAEVMATVNNPPECDIEIELLSKNYLKNHSAEEIAFKMLWKLYSIIIEIRQGNIETDIVSSQVRE